MGRKKQKERRRKEEGADVSFAVGGLVYVSFHANDVEDPGHEKLWQSTRGSTSSRHHTVFPTCATDGRKTASRSWHLFASAKHRRAENSRGLSLPSGLEPGRCLEPQ